MSLLDFFGIRDGAEVYLLLTNGQNRTGVVRGTIADGSRRDEPLGIQLQSGHGFEAIPWHAVATIRPAA